MALVSTQRKIVLLKISAVIYINNISKHDYLNFWMYLKLHTISLSKSKHTRFAFLMALIVAQSKIVFWKYLKWSTTSKISLNTMIWIFEFVWKYIQFHLPKAFTLASLLHGTGCDTKQNCSLQNIFPIPLFALKLWTIFCIGKRLDVGSPDNF